MKGCRTSYGIHMAYLIKSVKYVCVWVFMYDVTTRRLEDTLNQQEVSWQQVQESLNKCNQDIKRPPKENSGAPHQLRAGEKTNGAEMEETGNG